MILSPKIMMAPVNLEGNVNLMTVDPGKAGTGVAIWHGINLLKIKQYARITNVKGSDLYIPPLFTGIRVHKEIKEYTDFFTEAIQRFNINYVVMEDAQFYESSSKGMMAARSDSLVKLAKTIGTFEACYMLNGVEYDLVKPQNWKGNLSKEIIIDRIKEVTGGDCPSSHAADAVGIGLWKMGLINTDLKDKTKYYNLDRLTIKKVSK